MMAAQITGNRIDLDHTIILIGLLWVMCGRLLIGKVYFEVCASWSGAVMCPALYEADFVKAVRPAPKRAVEPGVSRC